MRISNNKLMYKKIVDYGFTLSEKQDPYRHHSKHKGKKYAKAQARRRIRRFYNKESNE